MPSFWRMMRRGPLTSLTGRLRRRVGCRKWRTNQDHAVVALVSYAGRQLSSAKAWWIDLPGRVDKSAGALCNWLNRRSPRCGSNRRVFRTDVAAFVTRYDGQQEIGTQVIAEELQLPTQNSQTSDLLALPPLAEVEGKHEPTGIKQAMEASKSREQEERLANLPNELAKATRPINELDLPLRPEAAKSAQLRGERLDDEQIDFVFDEIKTGVAVIDAELETAAKDKRAPRPRKRFARHLERIEQVIEPRCLAARIWRRPDWRRRVGASRRDGGEVPGAGDPPPEIRLSRPRRRALASARTKSARRSLCFIIHGAPRHGWVAGNVPLAIRRRIVVVLTEKTVAASLIVASWRSARSPGR